jgi:hypothetical protein
MYVDMRHPVECFDSSAQGAMASALAAAVTTMRLTGIEPDDAVRWEMASRIMSAARSGSTVLALAEAALDDRWPSDARCAAAGLGNVSETTGQLRD